MAYLKIKQLASDDGDDSSLKTILTLPRQSPSLKQLHISSTSNRLNNIRLIERLIDYYQSSLEQLTLKISLNRLPDGDHLQRILASCSCLRKYSFVFSSWQEENELFDTIEQFQSDWWLDSRRSPVLMFRGNHCETLIVSMPCSLDDYIWFPIDPNDWILNKSDLNSPDIHFTKQKCIRFSNTHHQLITLDLVHIIGHVFRATKQELSIPHWKFVSPDLLIEQVSLFNILLETSYISLHFFCSVDNHKI